MGTRMIHHLYLHLYYSLKLMGCMGPYHQANPLSRLLTGHFNHTQLEAFNNPQWHRILVVEHPRVRFEPIFQEINQDIILDYTTLGIIYLHLQIHMHRII